MDINNKSVFWNIENIILDDNHNYCFLRELEFSWKYLILRKKYIVDYIFPPLIG